MTPRSDPHTAIRHALDWARAADHPLSEHYYDDALAALAALESERDEARDTKRELHRAAQAAESLAANVNAETVERLDAELAQIKVERHQYRNENEFMKSERKRLQREIRELTSDRRAAEARVTQLEGDVQTVIELADGMSKDLADARNHEGAKALSILASRLDAALGVVADGGGGRDE